MIICNCSLNIFFPPIVNIREYIFDIEKQLDNYQKPFTLVPLPEGAPIEIPRITGTTMKNHSQLNVSLQNAQIVTHFDENYSDDFEKCFKYVNIQRGRLNKVIDETLKCKRLFCGASFELEYNNIGEPSKYLLDTIMKVKSDTEIYDIASNITLVYNEQYYINISVQNKRNFSGPINPNLTSLASMNEGKQTVLVRLDVNDRYGFNKSVDYTSSNENMEKVIDISKKIITKKLDLFIKEGEINVGDL